MQRNVRCLQLNAVRHATYATGICFDSTLDDGGGSGSGGDWNSQRDSHKYCTIFQLAVQAHLAACRTADSAHSVWPMELGEHFNAMSINYVVDFQQHTHNINTQPELADLLRERMRVRLGVAVFACRT